MRGIESKTIEMKFAQPIQRIADDEVAGAVRVLVIEVERFAPVSLVTFAEVVRRKAFEIVAVGSEMVVDDIENDGEPVTVSCVDESLEPVVIAINMIGREQLHAVVAPIPASGTLGNRHHFEHRDAEIT